MTATISNDQADVGLPDEPPADDGAPARTPPNDIAAEQCVLGAMMMSKDAIADVIGTTLKADSFYQPKHGIVFDAILDLYGKGEPADQVTIASYLIDQGTINRVGGAPYLHTLVSCVPNVMQVGYYARIVERHALGRRFTEAAAAASRLAWSTGDVQERLDRAQQHLYDVHEHRQKDEASFLTDLMSAATDELEAISSRDGGMLGIPTGFVDLDKLLNGLQPGQLVVVAGRPAMGKALALDTPLPTPGGWTTMGKVKVGDHLIGADGQPTQVVAATDVMHGRPCYEVEFSDGTVIVADAQHQWVTTTRAERRQKSENHAEFYWPAEDIARVVKAAQQAQDLPDQRVTTGEVLAEVGDVFTTVLRSRVVRSIPCLGREPRKVVRTKPRYIEHTWAAQVYSRRALLAALAAHVTVPKLAAQRHAHQSIKTTEEIAATVRTNTADRRANHAVANGRPLAAPDADLLIPPYTLGAWLGDGHSEGARFTTADPEMAVYIEDDGFVVVPRGNMLYSIQLPEEDAPAARNCAVCGAEFQPRAGQVMTCGRSCGSKSRKMPRLYPPSTCVDCDVPMAGGSGGRRCMACHHRFGTVGARLHTLGVRGDKHIPSQYLRASEAQRRALLAGLLDTDGTAGVCGNVEFVVTNRRLAEDVRELVASLGYRPTVTTRRVKGRSEATSTAYKVNFTTTDDVFRLERKRLAHKQRRRNQAGSKSASRYIVDVRPVESVPVRCVQVDNDDHLYLASRSWIPTHNSTLGLDFLRTCAIRNNLPGILFSLEMSKVEVAMRLLSAEARVPLQRMRDGSLNDEDWVRLSRRMGEIDEAPLLVDETANMSLMEMTAKARRMRQRNDVRLIVVDYLQLMSSGRRADSRQQEVADISRGLKLLGKELEVPVVAISQLNRGPEQRTDKRPMMSDLRESGAIEQDSDVIILLHREDYYDKDSPRPGEADAIVAKQRNGPTGTVVLAAQLHLSRFADLAV